MSTDLLVRFYDNYTRTFDSLKKNIDPIREKEFEQDAVVNHGVGYIEDRGLTHGISQGATNSGVYGILDLICNQKSQVCLDHCVYALQGLCAIKMFIRSLCTIGIPGSE